MHYKCRKSTIRAALSKHNPEKSQQSTKKKVTACVWHPRQPQPDPVVTLRNDHKFVIQTFRPVIPDYFKGELMEQRGALLLVSWSLCGPAGGSFREKWLDRVAWRSSAGTGRSCGVTAAPGTISTKSRSCHCHRVTCCCTAPATHLALGWGLPGGAGEHEANFAAFSRFAVISVFYTL